MRAIHVVVAVVALVAMAWSRPAAAQGVTVSVGGGAAAPLGILNSVTNTGVHGMVAVSVAPATVPLSVRIDGMYSHLGLSGDVGGHFRVFQGTANAVYRFSVAEATTIRPYLSGGLGVYNYQFITDLPEGIGGDDDPNTDVGLNGGAGVDVVVGALGMFAEARYHSVFVRDDNVELLPITVGVRFVDTELSGAATSPHPAHGLTVISVIPLDLRKLGGATLRPCHQIANAGRGYRRRSPGSVPDYQQNRVALWSGTLRPRTRCQTWVCMVGRTCRRLHVWAEHLEFKEDGS